MTTEDFRASQSLKMKSRRIESDLFRAQKACRQLDMSKEITEPVEIWFWPKTIAEAPGILFTFRVQSFTSLLEDLRQDVNRVSSFSWCRNAEHFFGGIALLKTLVH